jgi:hypothetical protein
MSRFDKIAFIKSFWSDFFEIKNLEVLSENQLNILIKTILAQIKYRQDGYTAVQHVLSFPLFLN